jgi:hypothetical protein
MTAKRVMDHQPADAAGRRAVLIGAPSGARAPMPSPIARLFDRAGIVVDGGSPWDLQLHDPEAWRRMMRHGVLGFGESYMDGLSDCPQLDELVCRLLRADADRVLTLQSLPGRLWQLVLAPTGHHGGYRSVR